MGANCTRHTEDIPSKRAYPKLSPKISEFSEEYLVIHKLTFFRNILNEQRSDYVAQCKVELAKAKENKADKGRAKFFLQKMRICQEMTKKIDDRIMIVEKQLFHIRNMQEDIQFNQVLAKGTELLRNLSKEVDTKSFQNAMDIMTNYEESSSEVNNLLVQFGNVTNDSEIVKEYDNLDQTSNAKIDELLRPSHLHENHQFQKLSLPKNDVLFEINN